ncbi:3-hydroxybutyryl-CoA dehydrogenase [Pontibacterium granulatum]|uniref:3-hydroxybutyryl-CoA dehydrogenase n=1 Tax=Pontibacterium granulatum TaxID=2036029 RepID=UPI00249C91F2|nr:3-hydroxybutyryl-CoA dehydrogenase [Pontibacterium granulatum]MDI3326341.1 3-hydroxybutyryl-CoA dehydrogenase [Pontibacterium granulatum]
MSFQQIGVIGAGQMGRGITQVMATAGYELVMVDLNENALHVALSVIETSLTKLQDKGLIEERPSAILGRIRTETDMNTLADCDLVIEAATENEEIKNKIFKQLDELCKPDAILASNTSSLSITRLAAQTSRPEKVIGMHFMNPVPVLALVEIINGLQTAPETTEKVVEAARRAGKEPIPVKDKAAFVLNRILLPMINEAIFALEEGCAEVEQIDSIMKLGASHPIGPLALADLIGLDTCLSIMNVLYENFGDSKYRPAPYLRQMVDAGYLGRKSGRGFYQY